MSAPLKYLPKKAGLGCWASARSAPDFLNLDEM